MYTSSESSLASQRKRSFAFVGYAYVAFGMLIVGVVEAGVGEKSEPAIRSATISQLEPLKYSTKKSSPVSMLTERKSTCRSTYADTLYDAVW